jgi:hypothetical protein
MTERRVWLTFPNRPTVEQPIICRMARHLPGVEFDIRQATVKEDLGIMAVLLRGEPETVTNAIGFLRAEGVQVDPIEKSVVEG